jgi:hypothetical protein
MKKYFLFFISGSMWPDRKSTSEELVLLAGEDSGNILNSYFVCIQKNLSCRLITKFEAAIAKPACCKSDPAKPFIKIQTIKYHHL